MSARCNRLHPIRRILRHSLAKPPGSAGILPAFLRSHATCLSRTPHPESSVPLETPPLYPPIIPLTYIRASRANAAIVAPQLTSSSGSRKTLRCVHFRAEASVIDLGSARSNATAFGMKSRNDHTRAIAWLINATHNQPRTAGAGHAATRAEITESSNAV
jgi:hypothetical protein